MVPTQYIFFKKNSKLLFTLEETIPGEALMRFPTLNIARGAIRLTGSHPNGCSAFMDDRLT
jgi:hypothetical protein